MNQSLPSSGGLLRLFSSPPRIRASFAPARLVAPVLPEQRPSAKEANAMRWSVLPQAVSCQTPPDHNLHQFEIRNLAPTNWLRTRPESQSFFCLSRDMAHSNSTSCQANLRVAAWGFLGSKAGSTPSGPSQFELSTVQSFPGSPIILGIWQLEGNKVVSPDVAEWRCDGKTMDYGTGIMP